MYRLGRDGLICLVTMFIPTPSGYHDVRTEGPLHKRSSRLAVILQGTRLLRKGTLSFDKVPACVSGCMPALGMSAGLNM